MNYFSQPNRWIKQVFLNQFQMKLQISIFCMKEPEVWNSGLLSYLVDVESRSSADK